MRAMMESAARFLDFDKIDVVPMSEYVLHAESELTCDPRRAPRQSKTEPAKLSGSISLSAVHTPYAAAQSR
jgi:hypothetical protein